MKIIYETDADLEREDGIVRTICEAYSCGAFKMPRKSRLDHILTRGGEVVALIEIKSRTCSVGKYETYMISQGKYEALVNYSKRTHLPVAIFVRWTDRLGFVNVPCDHTEGHGGRYDRGDDNDREKVVYIPIADFKRVCDL